MRLFAIIISLWFAACASFAAAQTTDTNLFTTSQAVKLASRLYLGMREKDVTDLLQRGGLTCRLERMGGSFHWLNSCALAENRRLTLEFNKSSGRISHWEDGLLYSVYITSRTGEKVLSITLTNKPLTADGPMNTTQPGESSFYRTFLDSVSTNDLARVVAVTSPSLVDTNNRGLKVARSTNSLRR